MTIWIANERDAPSIHDQPRMEVHSWLMLKSITGELRLVTLRDRDVDGGVVRLTSPIESIDNSSRVVTTSSGRQYLLMLPPASQTLDQQVLLAGASRLGLSDATDVSEWVWGQMPPH